MAKALLLGHAAFMFMASNTLSYLAVTNVAVNKCANKEALKAHLPFVIIVAGVMGIMTRQAMFYIDYLLPYGSIDLKDTWTTFPPHHIFLSVFVGLVVIFATIFMDVLTQDGPRMLNICRNMNVLSLSRFSKTKIKTVDTHEEYYDRLIKLHNKYCNITKVSDSSDKVGICVTSDPSKDDFDEFDAIDKYYVSKFEPDLTAFLDAITKFNETYSTSTNAFKKHNDYISSDYHKENHQKFNWLKSTGLTVMQTIPPEDVDRYDAYNSENCELIRFMDELKGKMKNHKDKSKFFSEVNGGTDYNNFRGALVKNIENIENKYKQKATRNVIEKLAVDSDQSKQLVKILLFYIYAYSSEDVQYKTMFLTTDQISGAKQQIDDVDKIQKAIDKLNEEIKSIETAIDLTVSTSTLEEQIKTNEVAIKGKEGELETARKALADNQVLKIPTGSTAMDVIVSRIKAYIQSEKKKTIQSEKKGATGGKVTGVPHFDDDKFTVFGYDTTKVRCDDKVLTEEKFKKATLMLSKSGEKYYRDLGPYYYKTNLDNIKNYRTRLATLFSGVLRKKVVTNFASCEDDYLRRNIINGYTWIMIMWPSVELYSAIANVKTAFFKDNQAMTFVFMGASVILPTLYGVFLYGGAGIAQGNSVFMNLLSSSKEIVQKVVKVNTEIGSYTFDANEETKVEDIKKGLDEKEEDISWTDYGLFYNETPLTDMTKTLKILNIGYGSTLSLRKTTVIEETPTDAGAGSS